MRVLVPLVVFVTVAGCVQTVPAPPPPDAPRITRFEASSQVVSPHESVQLSFSTTGATEVTLVDDSAAPLQLTGSVDEGSTTVAPSHTSFYVLRVSGPGGVTNAFVQIAVNEPLREAFLVAVPPELEAGQSSQLLWSAPGASQVSLTTGSGMPAPLTGTSGVVPITPSQSTTYRLTARAAPSTPALEALVEVRVRPVIEHFDFSAANGVQVGQPLHFTWQTRGATQLTLTERTLGQLAQITGADVAMGSFDFTVPATLPSGMALTDGLPLHFTLSATAGTAQALAATSTTVGNLPAFERVNAPDAVTAAHSFLLEWRTLNASRVTVQLGGLNVFETPSTTPERAVNGNVRLPAPVADADYVLIASNDRGQTASTTVHVRLVPLPTITTFTVPATLASPGANGTAQWVTTDAVRLTLRLEEDGPALANISSLSAVRMGSTNFTLASTASLVLEAVNAAGDAVTERKPVRITTGAATLTPSLAVRSETTTATLSWQLASLGVTETIGVPSNVTEVAPANFIDLTTSLTAHTVDFADVFNGAERIDPGEGFTFPLLGQRQREVWVSANGFISFAQPGALTTNTDLGLDGSGDSMLAPLWDDLVIPATGSVLYELQTAPDGERVLVVQWNNVQREADIASELTFQAQLFESGHVTFAYQTLTSPGTSFTVGARAQHERFAQSYIFDDSGNVLVEGNGLELFTRGPSDGTREVTTSSSRTINFFGRTAAALVPVSVTLRTVAAGSVKLTEAMPFPVVAASVDGQWLELRNELEEPFDVEGLVVTSNASTTGTTLPSRVLAPGEYLLLGQSTNTVASGGAPVQLVWSDLSLAANETVNVSAGGQPVTTLSWDGGVLGQSIFLSEDLLVAPGVVPSCARTQTFGNDGANGTPGAANESCAPYVISRVDAGYVELGYASTTLLAGVNDSSGFGTVVLPAPFTYFGQSVTSLSLSVGNGFFTFGLPLVLSEPNNPATPDTLAPNGVVAPFWDALTRDRNNGGAVKLQRFPGRTIISWQEFRLASDPASHLSFQVHLVDPDIVEFHYGAMTTSSGADAMTRGSSATIWLEAPTGSVAVPFSVNQERVGSFVPGVRFTPAP